MKFLALVNRVILPLKRTQDASKFSRILVVSNSGLGDTLLSTPAIVSLRMAFPGLHITFLVNAKMYPLFKRLDFIDDYLLYYKGVWAQIKLIKALRKKNIDTVFLFHSNGPEDIFFSILSGAKNILKMTYSQHHKFSKLFLNRHAEHSKHNIDNKLDMVRFFGVEDVVLEMQVPEHLKNCSGYIEKHKKYTYIGLQVGTQDLYKMWPIEKFIHLVNIASDKYLNLRFVLFGSTRIEVELSKKLATTVKKAQVIINICGKTAIDELPVAVNDMDVIVTGDTGILHLAITLKKRTISLFGPTNHREYGPYQDLE